MLKQVWFSAHVCVPARHSSTSAKEEGSRSSNPARVRQTETSEEGGGGGGAVVTLP